MPAQTQAIETAPLQQELNLLLQMVVGQPRVEAQCRRVHRAAAELQTRIDRLQETADAESDTIHDLCKNCAELRNELEIARALNIHLQDLINNPGAPA
jgi:HD superfamily phosphohydrolase YqeK